MALADFDNDGRLDLYEANGKVDGDPGAAPDAFAEPNSLFRGLDDGAGWVRFDPVQPPGGVNGPMVYTSRALAVGDVDDDGGLDLLVVNRDGPAHLLMNRVPMRGAWVRFRVVTESGRHALGARASARIGSEEHHKTVQAAGSYLASHDPRVHFGLGSAASVRAVRVLWPDGALESSVSLKRAGPSRCAGARDGQLDGLSKSPSSRLGRSVMPVFLVYYFVDFNI
ncbi:MAG: ASPIC/UnbV domain-containing protein [Pseudomonadales bacterium]|nr:ASPIC/UnbV domain-containing protein [Pseudomonadales bacterium]